MKFIKENWNKLILIAYYSILPAASFAATCPDGSNADGRVCNPLGNTTSLPALIQTILNDAIKIGSPVIVFAVIYCGFLFVSARGNAEKITKAKEALLWTLIGAGVLLGSMALAQMIQTTVTSLGS